jgi:hypothetical protein
MLASIPLIWSALNYETLQCSFVLSVNDCLTQQSKSPSWESNSHSVKKFPAFYITRRWINLCRKHRHWSLSWAKWIHPTSLHTVSLTSIWIWGCIQKFSDWPPGTITANGTALCH